MYLEIFPLLGMEPRKRKYISFIREETQKANFFPFIRHKTQETKNAGSFEPITQRFTTQHLFCMEIYFIFDIV
jgi:hypothetical protein